MSEKKFKVVILTHGNAGRLLEHLSELKSVEVAGVFVETAASPKRGLRQKIKRSIRYDGFTSTMTKFAAKLLGGGTKGSEEMEDIRENQKKLSEHAERLGVPIYRVENYHSDTTIELLKEMDADLGILDGTNIIKESVFNIFRHGSINLHQGLAPLYRGGPTVFWELFNDEKEVGITIHFVAAKVDTGDIVVQKTLPLNYNFRRYGLDFENFLAEYRASLREPSLEMLVEAVRSISTGTETRTLQDTSQGTRYRLPVRKEKNELLRRLRKRLKAFKAQDIENREGSEINGNFGQL
ncbi:MAG: hypothetical protein H7070_11720 [Saprospiraceae bacterium]|nr:hypothetical protein [Pyrinomonadaceae bacterium]